MELFDLLTIKITLPAQAVPARKVWWEFSS